MLVWRNLVRGISLLDPVPSASCPQLFVAQGSSDLLYGNLLHTRRYRLCPCDGASLTSIFLVRMHSLSYKSRSV